MKQHIALHCAAAIIAAASLLAPAAHAQDGARIGFVDTDRLLRDAAPAKAAQARLEQEFSAREREIDQAGEALKRASDEFDRDALTMSESQRQSRQRQLVDQDRDLQRRQREFQEDLSGRKQEELQKILEHANRVVNEVAEREHYDVILQEAVYVSPKLDITEQVLKALESVK